MIAGSSGPSWADIMTAFGTVGAVAAAVGIAVASNRKTNKLVASERAEADRRLREQLDHSDDQLGQQREHSDRQLREQQEHNERQLEAERKSADERLQRQFARAEELEQRSQAVAVEVAGLITTPDGEFSSDPSDPNGTALVIVTNKSRYAVTNLDARLSPDGQSIVGFSDRFNLVDRRDMPQEVFKRIIGSLGQVYLGTIAPGAMMVFVGDTRLVRDLRAAFPIVRWIDHWNQCWEYKKGEVYESDMRAEWLPITPPLPS